MSEDSLPMVRTSDTLRIKEKKPRLYQFNALHDYAGLEINHPPGIYNHSISLSISTPDNSKIELIQNNKSIPFHNGDTLTTFTLVKITYRDSIGQNRNFIGSYIVNQDVKLPVISLYVNSSEFFPETGIYVGRMIAPDTLGGRIQTVGAAWKKKPITAYAQFFFNGRLNEELELDLKTYGGMTLGWKEKSLQLSARETLHGQDKIQIKAFPSLPSREYQHLVLRTSGNDQNKTRIKDLSLSKVAEEINLDTKASRQIIVYINGIYWGIHNLREKVNSDYFQYNYGWEKDSFVHLQGSGFKNIQYKSLVDYARQNYQNDDFNQRMRDSIDVENFFNFNIFQTYIGNPDYRGNVRFYKHTEGKWKWVVYDLDLAANNSFHSRNFIKDRTNPDREYWYNPPYAVDLLKYILKDTTFRNQFILQYTYLIASKLSTQNFTDYIEQSSTTIEPEIERHFQRREWLYKETSASRNKKINGLIEFFEKRPSSAIAHLQELFKLGATSRFTFSQNIKTFNSLTINNSHVHSNHIEGEFFHDLPFELTVLEKDHRYEFIGWSDGITTETRPIDPRDGPIAIEALFQHKPDFHSDGIMLQKALVQRKKNKALIFVSVLNPTTEKISLQNKAVHEDINGMRFEFGDSTYIHPGEEIIITNDCELFRQTIQDSTLKVFKFEGVCSDPFKIQLVFVDDWCWVDTMCFAVSDSLLIEHSTFLIDKKPDGINMRQMNSEELKEISFGVDIVFPEVRREEAPPQHKGFLWLGLGLIGVAAAYRKRILKLVSVIAFICQLTPVQSQDTLITTTVNEKAEECARQDQFGLSAIEKRVIDNKGKGDSRFDGTRNFRPVLYDLVYRGGGNNLHLKDTIPKYYLWNPMPMYGLQQLSKIGFGKAVYLYSHNFDYWYPQNKLDALQKDGFEYICRPQLNDYIDEYFADIMARANDPLPEMVYIHCWNGWHQSGLLSAYTLMQFCDFSNQEALNYWETCTDGNHKGFSKVKSNIRNYRPSEEYYFTAEQKEKYCPCLKEFKSGQKEQHEDDKINLSTSEMMENPNTAQSGKPYTYHTIVSGECLGTIALKYGMTVREIQKLNNLQGDLLYAGNKLKVYQNKNNSNVPKQKNPKSAEQNNIYTVKSGDTLSGIALKHKTTVTAIKTLNNMRSDLIFPGDKIQIPQ